MKTAYTFYIENATEKIILAKVADMNTAVSLLCLYRTTYAVSKEWQCYIKPARRTAQLVDDFKI
ncbi:hypothetical protein P7G87_00270 [Enterococcus asini]|uniref:hypothetical protein n=1 Tax=Enterococcus asini TaxID=57732 RepID=UPI0028905506|nr:hypothetical protein [Enterococcus asini]MDT2783121.1 hypothetical protein [Enterococcus asini]